MEVTGRMKDLYDIDYFATSFDFEGRKIQEAIYETFSNRGTPYEKDSIQVINRLSTNGAVINRWDIFCRKVLKYQLDLNEVVKPIISFVDPPFQAMVIEDELLENWN